MDHFRISQEAKLRREESARRQRMHELCTIVHEAELAAQPEKSPAQPGRLTRLFAQLSGRLADLLPAASAEETCLSSGAFSQEQLGG